jgi:hypothetical protein
LSPSAADLSVTPVGTNTLNVHSDGSTLFCGFTAGVYTYPASGFNPTTCGAGTTDLMAALAVYNPGWSAPISGSDWIGVTANGGPSSDYRAETGLYVYQETFTLPVGATSVTLNLGALADNAVAVYLNGTLLGGQTVTDCNTAPCNWSPAGQLTISSTGGATLYTDGTTLNRLTFALINTPIGYPLTSGPLGGPAPSYGCFRAPQTNGTAGFGSTLVATSPDHVYSGRTTTIVGGIGCENPTGVDFKGTITWTVAVTTWCSPGFWKNHEDLWSQYLLTKYSTLVGAADLSKKAPAGDPTLQQVIENPQTYGGPATNSVADFLSNKAFGTPIGSGVESCPDPGSITVH